MGTVERSNPLSLWLQRKKYVTHTVKHKSCVITAECSFRPEKTQWRGETEGECQRRGGK